ncbi:hypothetical protein B0H13DRAFT_1867117 [Mycena leptocephala]|nr:hypothetical protein B0H13DRAFT_1867117 [Mycena leptocephala]
MGTAMVPPQCPGLACLHLYHHGNCIGDLESIFCEPANIVKRAVTGQSVASNGLLSSWHEYIEMVWGIREQLVRQKVFFFANPANEPAHIFIPPSSLQAFPTPLATRAASKIILFLEVLQMRFSEVPRTELRVMAGPAAFSLTVCSDPHAVRVFDASFCTSQDHPFRFNLRFWNFHPQYLLSPVFFSAHCVDTHGSYSFFLAAARGMLIWKISPAARVIELYPEI